VKVGMALTAHKTVTMFMRYVHSEDDPIRAAADLVAARRKCVIEAAASGDTTMTARRQQPRIGDVQMVECTTRTKPAGIEDGKYTSRTKLKNYRPFRHRNGDNRPLPPGTVREAGRTRTNS